MKRLLTALTLGVALAAAPAMGASATAAPSAATPTATVPAPTSTPTPAPTGTPTPSPRAAAPTDLTVTSPEDGDTLPDRSFVVTGTAPVGTVVEVGGFELETPLARQTTTSVAFEIPVTIPAGASYDQYLYVTGTLGNEYFSETDLQLTFPAPTSATPSITPALDGHTFVVAPDPFSTSPGSYGQAPQAPFVPFVLTGTGTAGETVSFDVTPVGSTDDGEFSSYWTSDAVARDGRWTETVHLAYGTYEIAATQQLVDDDYNRLTVPSDESGAVTVTLAPPAGYVPAPVLSTPAYPDSSNVVIFFGADRDAMLRPAAKPRGPQDARTSPRTIAPSPFQRMPRDFSLVGSWFGDEGDPTAGLTQDQLFEKFGIQVAGTPDAAKPGLLTTPVSGTGTPGDHIVLYRDDPDAAQDYFQNLYPDYFLANYGEEGEVAGKPTSKLPVDTDEIVVAADGTWSTTVALAPGVWILSAFEVADPDSASPRYSLASAIAPIHLTGTPAEESATPAGGTVATPAGGVAATPVAAATGELAYTGSDSRGLVALALGALAAGSALVVAARRRRVRP